MGYTPYCQENYTRYSIVATAKKRRVFMNFLFPIDGDVLLNADVNTQDGRSYTTVQVAASPFSALIWLRWDRADTRVKRLFR